MVLEEMAKLKERVDRLYAQQPPSQPIVTGSPWMPAVPPMKPTLLATQPNAEPVFSNGVCQEDFWMKNKLGCKKGSLKQHYDVAKTVMGILGDPNMHLNVIVPTDASKPWAEAQKKAGDPEVLWLNGEEYVYSPDENTNVLFSKWVAAGSPSRNSRGSYDVRGAPVAPDAWAGRRAD
jgi:hypothetical protein